MNTRLGLNGFGTQQAGDFTGKTISTEAWDENWTADAPLGVLWAEDENTAAQWGQAGETKWDDGETIWDDQTTLWDPLGDIWSEESGL